MRRIVKLAGLILGLSTSLLHAQSQCKYTFSLDNTHTSVLFNNQTLGCTAWTVIYFSSGFSALSLTVETAPNGINSSVPGTFTAMTGFPVSVVGDNGLSSVSLASWVRVRLASSTGTGQIIGQVYGTVGGFGAISTIAQGTVGSDFGQAHPFRIDLFGDILTSGGNISGADGLSNTQSGPNVGNGGLAAPAYYSIFPYSFNGSTWDRNFVCPLSAPITFSAASGTLQIVGLSASKIIRVCHVSLSSTVATDITLVYGTGSNCGSGTTSLTGAYKGVTTLALDFGPEAALRTASANEFCITSSAVATVGGVVSYAQF